MQSATQFYRRSHDAVIRVYDKTGNVIDTHNETLFRRDAHQHCRLSVLSANRWDTNRPFQFHKRRQLFIRMHNEPFSVAAMRVIAFVLYRWILRLDMARST